MFSYSLRLILVVLGLIQGCFWPNLNGALAHPAKPDQLSSARVHGLPRLGFLGWARSLALQNPKPFQQKLYLGHLYLDYSPSCTVHEHYFHFTFWSWK